MNVPSIFNAILHRVGRNIITDFGAPFVLESMDRIYHETNDNLRALIKEYTFTFDSDDADNGYIDLPSDWLWPVRIDPFRIFRHVQTYKSSEPNTCTFELSRFYVAGVQEDDVFDAMYYALGKQLVNETDTEYAAQNDAYKLIYTNVPEWSPTHLHAFLIYATAMELAADYPLRAQDEVAYQRLYTQLDRRAWLKTLAQPIEEGPDARQTTYTSNVDPYEIT